MKRHHGIIQFTLALLSALLLLLLWGTAVAQNGDHSTAARNRGAQDGIHNQGRVQFVRDISIAEYPIAA